MALLVSTCGREAAHAVQMLEARGHSMTVNQMRCFEGQVPPDIRTICKFMADTANGGAQLKKMGKRSKLDRLWSWHLCHPENNLIHESRVCLPSHKDASAVAVRLQFVVRGAGASTHRSEMPFWCLQTLRSQSVYYDC